MKSKKLMGLPVVESDNVPPATAEFAQLDVVRDCLGVSVLPGDQLITARGELLTAVETPLSIWRRGAGIAVEDRKHVKTYRPASMLLRLDADMGYLAGKVAERDRALVFAKLTATFQEQRRSELKARRGFRH